jgi:hypothetical protein
MYQFIVLSDGVKRTYYDKDGLKHYPDNIIRDPKSVSFTSLYINGVLQPLNHYHVQRGKLQLHTEDAPPKGAPIILQFVKLYLESKRKRKQKRKKRTPWCDESEEE